MAQQMRITRVGMPIPVASGGFSRLTMFKIDAKDASGRPVRNDVLARHMPKAPGHGNTGFVDMGTLYLVAESSAAEKILSAAAKAAGYTATFKA